MTTLAIITFSSPQCSRWFSLPQARFHATYRLARHNNRRNTSPASSFHIHLIMEIIGIPNNSGEITFSALRTARLTCAPYSHKSIAILPPEFPNPTTKTFFPFLKRLAVFILRTVHHSAVEQILSRPGRKERFMITASGDYKICRTVKIVLCLNLPTIILITRWNYFLMEPNIQLKFLCIRFQVFN